MIRTALSSAALAGSDIQKVLAAAVSSGVQGIEWTDGYLKPGESASAQEAMYATLKAGLCTASYATSGRARLDDRTAFRQALSTARVLNSPVLRLLPALRSHSPIADAELFATTARMLGDEAGEHGITLCFCIDADSVLDSSLMAASLLAQIDHPFVKLAWKPVAGAGFDDSMEAIVSLAGKVGLMVVCPDDLDGAVEVDGDRAEEWLQYLDALEEQSGSPDMTRHVVFMTMPEKAERLSSAVATVKSWSATLRRYHQRRVY